MKILVTAGPTHEYIDDVRFIGNPSSGKAGYAVARSLAEAGHKVFLVSGPCALPVPRGVKSFPVVSAREMERAALLLYPKMDAVVMAAAVGDYRPVRRIRGKMQKRKDTMTLRLVRNPDILAAMGKRKGKKILIGFALESQDPCRNALDKLRRKNLDAIVLNAPSSFGADRSDFIVIRRGGKATVHQNIDKGRLGRIVAGLL